MEIYTKTPLYKNSNIIAHLLEHTLYHDHPLSIKEYFEFFERVHGYEINWITKFKNIKKNEIEKFFSYYRTPPTKRNIRYELQILRQELKYPDFNLKLEEHIWKIFYWKDFRLNTVGKPSYEDIYYYHKIYCQDPVYLITDNNKDIYETNINYQLFDGNCITNYKKFYLNFQKNKYKIIYSDNTNPYNFYFIEFLLDLAERFNEYFYIYKKLNTDCPEIYWFYFPDYTVVAIPKESILNFTKEDFYKFKEYFIKECLDKELKELKHESILKNWNYLSNNQIKSFLKSLSYMFIKDILVN